MSQCLEELEHPMSGKNIDDEVDIIEVAQEDQARIFSKCDSEITSQKQSEVTKELLENDEDLLIIPSQEQKTIPKDLIENDEDLLIIDIEDVGQYLEERNRLQSFDEMRNYTNDKRFEEWVYVETDRITFQIRDNLLLVSSVYNNDKNCCVIQ